MSTLDESRRDALAALHFGEVDSESEVDLASRFLRTEDFVRFTAGRRVDLVLGPKGSGKSALFQLFARHAAFARSISEGALDGVIIHTGTGFRDVSELSTPEIESLRTESDFDFERLWMLYIALKAALAIGDEGLDVKGPLREFLREKGKARDHRILPLVRTLWRATVSGSPPSQFKVTVSGKSVEIGTKDEPLDLLGLLAEVDRLAQLQGKRIWLLFDNLDELFAAEPKTRTAALSALFAAVNQLRGRFQAIEPKIFLRTDLWADLSFNNKSHWVGKQIELSWSEPQLSLLLVKRSLSEPAVRAYLGQLIPAIGDGRGAEQLSVPEQRALYLAVYPKWIYEKREEGPSLQWMMDRSSDGQGAVWPRELITFGNEAAEAQRGLGGPATRALLGGAAIREAYPHVSGIRRVTFLSEFPELAAHFHRFRGKTTPFFHREELFRLMAGLTPSGEQMLQALHEVGVIAPVDEHLSVAKRFQVPLVFRPGLGLRLRGRP